jgi:phosphoglycerate dehydrogenase-like enzyme
MDRVAMTGKSDSETSWMAQGRPPPVLVLTEGSASYVDALSELKAQGVELLAAESRSEAERLEGPFPVILGAPDRVAAFLENGRPVDWVQSTWAGVSPLLDSGRRDYLLTGVRGVFGPQVSEFVMGYLLAHELKLLERLGCQAKKKWWSEPGDGLRDKTLAVLGTGSIGQHLAGTAAHFGLRVTGLNRSGNSTAGFHRVYPVEELEAFLGGADYLVCTLPQTPRTESLLDETAFRAVKPGCYLVNVGRGSVIDEAALLAALADGRLSGAVLDVFREEPLPADHPFWHAPGVLVTAHVAAKSRPQDIANIFIENYRRFLQGDELAHRIDFDRGY